MLCTALYAAVCAAASAQTISQYGDMRWRLVGPFRGGRTVAVAGVPQRPGTFYMAPTDGGIWKSDDYGRTWRPIFDGQDTGSIGALAIAPSDPNVIYAGSGEGLRRPDLSVGDGMYASRDAGVTWRHLGLRDGQQINALAVDPRDANRVFAAVVGHPYGPNPERGLYRSRDGGATWQKVLGTGVDQGAVDVIIDPRRPDTMYASLWASRNGPWNLLQVYEIYNQSGVYKSTDGGSTWMHLENGLPRQVGRVGLTIAPSNDQRLYALVEKPDACGVYRSDDAGASWREVNSEDRVCSRTEDFAGITADSADQNVVYSANTQTYRSSDGGKTWTGIKGAPGGDDYHTVWVDPNNRNIVLLGCDQGATLSVNYGATWSSWYNQPTAQFYHVIADDRFPYRVFGGQQESGSAEIASRGDDGAITFREFHPVGTEEYGYVAPDPRHPWLIYGGKATRYDERTHQTQDISPVYDRKRFRFDRTEPLVWNRVDKQTLYLGSNVIFATRNGGLSWRIISPDLTRRNPGEPATLRDFASNDPLNGKHRGVIYSIAPSYVDRHLIWAGTDDGLIWITRDAGAHWSNVTPPQLRPWNRVAQIDASHFDPNTAYIAVSNIRLDDMHPYAYRTHDGGRTWTPIASGLPQQPVNTVREDTKTRGLLYAGTERTAYVSFDDGSQWEPLQLNLPSTSVRDLWVHNDDLIAGTHGRSFWILDDLTPLRQMRAARAARDGFLFAPQVTYRVRRDTYSDTPLPPEEPAGQNPPDGALIDYYLPHRARGPLTIAIYDSSNRAIRTFASTDAPKPIDPEITVPEYWVRPSAIPNGGAGMHRFVWDLHLPAPASTFHNYPIAAIVHATPRQPEGAMALPGTYTVALTVDGRTYVQPLRVVMDPRVRATPAQLRAQFNLAARVSDLMNQSYAALGTARSHKDAPGIARYGALNAQLGQLLGVIESADAPPTAAQRAAVSAAEKQMRGRP